MALSFWASRTIRHARLRRILVRFLATRFARLTVVCAIVVVASFIFLHLIPGDPATIRLGEHADARQVAAMRAQLGLDKPWPVQLAVYAARIAHGDLGESIVDGQPTAHKLAQAFPATLELALTALMFAVVVGVPVGVFAAVHKRTWSDSLAMSGMMLGVSVPVFWLGWMLIYLLAVLPGRFGFDFFPISGRLSFAYVVPGRTHFLVLDALLAGSVGAAWDALRHLMLPAVTLGTIPLAIIAKITRSSMLEVLGSDYIRTARAKGASANAVLFGHALRNALIPMITVIGLQTGMLLGGAVLTEHIFAWPGVGRLAFNAISDRDAPLVNACILLFAAAFVLVNALVDLMYTVADPRLRS